MEIKRYVEADKGKGKRGVCVSSGLHVLWADLNMCTAGPLSIPLLSTTSMHCPMCLDALNFEPTLCFNL